MVSLNNVSLKLDKIKKAIGNNGVLRIYVWAEENEPIRVDLIYKKDVKHIYCYSMKEYMEILNKYRGIETLVFIGVEKPKPEDMAVA